MSGTDPKFARWYEKNSTHDEDFTYGEEAWKASRRGVWGTVFQIVSDNPHLASREFIRLLEAGREEDGYGPLSAR